MVSLAETRIDDEPGAFCQVGRTAEVRFERADVGQLRRLLAAAGQGLRAVFAGEATALGSGK